MVAPPHIIVMLTDIQRKYLQDVLDGKQGRDDDPHKYYVYMKRVQGRMDRAMENAVWLAKNMPEVFKDEDREYGAGLPKQRRLKALLIMIKCICPDVDIELVKDYVGIEK